MNWVNAIIHPREADKGGRRESADRGVLRGGARREFHFKIIIRHVDTVDISNGRTWTRRQRGAGEHFASPHELTDQGDTPRDDFEKERRQLTRPLPPPHPPTPCVNSVASADKSVIWCCATDGKCRHARRRASSAMTMAERLPHHLLTHALAILFGASNTVANNAVLGHGTRSACWRSTLRRPKACSPPAWRGTAQSVARPKHRNPRAAAAAEQVRSRRRR